MRRVQSAHPALVPLNGIAQALSAHLWEEAMDLALAEADLTAASQDVPIGAIVLDEHGVLLGRGHNCRELTGDPTAHAELLALREASQTRGHWRLTGCTLICTLEPCAMCAGALVNARVKRLVYGADDPKAGGVRSLFRIADEPRLNHRLEIVTGIAKEQSTAKLRAFFARLRAEGQKLIANKFNITALQ